jgi:hypothetical protein
VAEASGILGVSAEAVRGRIKRGSLKSARDSGTVYVLLPSDQSTDQTPQADDQTRDRTRDVFLDARIELLERMVRLSQERLEWLEVEVWRGGRRRRRGSTNSSPASSGPTPLAPLACRRWSPHERSSIHGDSAAKEGPAQYIGERQAATARPS